MQKHGIIGVDFEGKRVINWVTHSEKDDNHRLKDSKTKQRRKPRPQDLARAQ